MEEVRTFEEFNLSRRVMMAIKEMGFEEPSPIQAKAIPFLMQGHDVIGQAQTGTGKTATFGIPIIEKVGPASLGVQALIITPTRELAIQVAEEISKVGKYRGIKTLPIYGGQSIDRQIRALKFGVQVIIGTPGRLLDHLNRRTLKLDNLKMVVLDEADEMLDMGFVEDIESILNGAPAERQTLLFSATMPDEIRKLSKRYLKDPVTVTVSRDELTVPLIEQVYYEVKERTKIDSLCRILDVQNPALAIIFCRTKRGVDELVAGLQARGYQAEGLHGDLSQAQRNQVMRKFRHSKLEFLVATDVAARGLDIENVSHVINYDVPQDPESYVHRIGRTGRAGKTGMAITLIVPREYRQLRLIEKLVKTRISRGVMPTSADVAERQKEFIKGKIASVIKGGQLSYFHTLIEEMGEDFDTHDICAAALKFAFGAPETENEIEEESTLDFGNTGARPGMVRLFMSIGRNEGVSPQEIVRTIAEESGIPGNIIGAIRIYDRFTFVEVPQESAERVLNCMHRNTFKGKKVSVEPAKFRDGKK